MCHTHDLGSYAQGQGRDQRSKWCLSNNSKTTEANLTKLHRKIEHYDMVFHAQELGSYAQGQGSLAVFKVTARDQGHYKGPSGAFVTYCNISCFFLDLANLCKNSLTRELKIRFVGLVLYELFGILPLFEV